MKTKAMFLHKLPEMKTLDCEIEKVVNLSTSEYAAFYQQLLGNYDFITENDAIMGMKDGTAHCILVMSEELDEGILVNSSGCGFARSVSYFPNVSAYLQSQNQVLKKEEQKTAPQIIVQHKPQPQPVVQAVKVDMVIPALIAYGEKVQKYLDECIVNALDGHDDQGTYEFSYAELRDGFEGGGLDQDVFTAMLQARPEVVDMDVSGDDIGVVLSMEAIQEHADSKLRVLTQDEVVIMHAKHTLWRYGVGGLQADFTGCRLSGLDLHEMCFDGADLRGALIENCDMRNVQANSADFRTTRFVNCTMDYFTAEEADFSDAQFAECEITGSRLAESKFQRTVILDSNLTNADLTDADVKTIEIQDTETQGVELKGTVFAEAEEEPTAEMQMGGM